MFTVRSASLVIEFYLFQPIANNTNWRVSAFLGWASIRLDARTQDALKSTMAKQGMRTEGEQQNKMSLRVWSEDIGNTNTKRRSGGGKRRWSGSRRFEIRDSSSISSFNWRKASVEESSSLGIGKLASLTVVLCWKYCTRRARTRLYASGRLQTTSTTADQIIAAACHSHAGEWMFLI